MKNKLLKSICLISAFSVGAFVSNAQLLTKVTVQTVSDTHSHTMYDSGKMYFSGPLLVIDTMGNGNIVTTELVKIEKLLFSTFESSSAGEVRVVYDASDLAVVPNVADDHISILGIDGNFVYQIINTSGYTIAEGSTSAGEAVDVASFPKGVYFVRVNGSILKFVKI